MEGQKQRSKVINYVIQNDLKGAYDDLLVIKNSNDLNGYINDTNKNTLIQTQEFFLRIANNKKKFDQIRLLDSSGNEIIRVNNPTDGAYIVPYNKLEDKGDKYYYQQTSELSKDGVFISDMDLNMENGEIEVPYKPTIRFCTPIYSKDNKYQGILIVNYLTQDILSSIGQQYEDFEYGFIKPSLLNDRGYYLYNIDSNENFGFMFQDKKSNSIETDDLELWKQIKLKDTGYYQKGNEVIFFKNINPLENINLAGEYNYSWTIISKFNLSDLPTVQDNIFFGMKNRDLLMLLGISILILILVIVNYHSKKDKEELIVSSKIADNITDAILITDQHTVITYVNKAFEKITGYSKDQILGFKTNRFKSGKQSVEFYKDMWKCINLNGYWSGELWDRRKDGFLYPKKLSIHSIKDNSKGNVVKYIGIFNDLTEHIKGQEYVEKLKNYNLKTNLPNEYLTNRLIDNIILENRNNFTLIYFSIENYNNILIKLKDNNNFIIELVKLIKKSLKGEDFIAQITKNNFVIGLSSFSTREETENFIWEFFEENKKPYNIDNDEIFFDIKAGISIYPKDGNTSEELITNAYIALENVLNQKESKYRYYSYELKMNMERESEMDILLRKAILNNELRVHYQPQVEIDNETTVGAEALLRWENRELGNISPMVFITLAEKTGQIIEIGYWLIERIFKDYSSIREKISEDFRISINISPLQFKDEKLIYKFKEYAEKYNVDFRNFEIEVTESIFMTDLNDVNDKLNEFKKLGMTVAIDDFGTGFSSLSYLKKLSVDKLKIDRSFIKDYPQNDNGEIAEVITNMAKKLKLKVITEGAETEEQINYLQSIGCNLIQGFYYSKPLDKDDFYKYLS
jgi:PAS domain S-box-containing protein